MQTRLFSEKSVTLPWLPLDILLGKEFDMKSLLLILSLFSTFCFATESQDKTDLIVKALGDRYIPRSDWGQIIRNYDELLTSGKISADEAKEIATLHHTVTGSMTAENGKISPDNEYITVQEIEKLHINDFSFADVGYHYMIGQSGKVYEGRPLKYTGSHTGGLNEKNAGIAFIGCYDDEGCVKEGYQVTEVTEEMISSAASLIAYLSLTEGMSISPETVIPRSLYDLKVKDKTKFPYSPGNRIIERVKDIVDLSLNKIDNLRQN